MSNTTGIKGAGVDVARRLQRAGEAIVTPKKLGTEGLEAFKTLRVLDDLASLLPPAWQGITKALIGLGISNVGQHAEPQAKDAVRGYTSALAIKSGRVPADVIAQAAGPQQKQALIEASANGDLATVKSILRHNKKHGANVASAPEPPQPKEGEKSVVRMAGADRPRAGEKSGSGRNAIKPDATHGRTQSSVARDIAAGMPFEKVLMRFMEGLEKKFQAEVDQQTAAFEMAERKARHADGKAHFAGRPGVTLADAAGNPVHVSTDGPAASATRLNKDGTETTLSGKELAAFTADLSLLERSVRSSRTHATDDQELLKMLAKLQEALQQARG